MRWVVSRHGLGGAIHGPRPQTTRWESARCLFSSREAKSGRVWHEGEVLDPTIRLRQGKRTASVAVQAAHFNFIGAVPSIHINFAAGLRRKMRNADESSIVSQNRMCDTSFALSGQNPSSMSWLRPSPRSQNNRQTSGLVSWIVQRLLASSRNTQAMLSS